MSARALLRRRVVVAADAFVEVVAWEVPKAIPPSRHGFKYRLAYVVAGQCVLRYDNERGKGDHRHFGVRTALYRFSSPERLMEDLLADVERWNREHRRS
jgi:hypothetical protein